MEIISAATLRTSEIPDDTYRYLPVVHCDLIGHRGHRQTKNLILCVGQETRWAGIGQHITHRE